MGILVFVLLLTAVTAAEGAGGRVRFHATSTRLAIHGPGYRLVLARRNGKILELDQGPVRLTDSTGLCLWGAVAGPSSSYVGGCSFAPSERRTFSYRWKASTATLTLAYREARFGAATVTIHAGTTFLDLRLRLANRRATLDRVRFPAGLNGDTRTVTAGYAPNTLPGVRLAPAYFARVGTDVQSYPSRWAFADYLAYDVGTAHLALYTVAPTGPLHPAEIGFAHLGAPLECSGTAFCVIHEFETWIRRGQTWTSPIVRLRIGETAQESILAYRRDNGIDAYPSLADKLGARATTYAEAPLIKANVPLLRPFSQWASHLNELPTPSLLHPVGFQRGGFDANDPDFLPPDPILAGTTADFAAMIAAAHRHGDLVLPYGNLSWWDPSSPSSEAAPTEEIAALQANLQPQTVDYGSRTGLIVSPYAPAVKARIARYMAEWTIDVPSDCLFLDQTGARPWLYDFNPASPTPLAYADGWLSVLATFRARCLMVEDGWDRLARDAIGFHGGLLMMSRELDLPNRIYGAGNWEPYPLATWLVHDKVLMYQHDLYDGTMAIDNRVLTWNMLFGLVSSYSWDALTPGDNPRLDLVGLLQRDFGPEYVGVRLGDYAQPEPGVAETTYGDMSVVGNFGGSDYLVDGYGIAPDGFLARTEDGSLTAAIVESSFDGIPLSPGIHALVVERSAASVTVHQPIGAETDVGVAPPSSAVGPLRATAEAADGRPLGSVAGALMNGRFVFRYRSTFNGQPAAAYRIAAG
jgi:hypothetical protein